MRGRRPGTLELTVSAGRHGATGRYRPDHPHDPDTSKREAKAALATLETAVAAGRVSFEDQTGAELPDSPTHRRGGNPPSS